MRIFEKEGPLDPGEEDEPSPLPGALEEPTLEAPAPLARGRSLGIFLLVLVDLALGGLAIAAVFWFGGARGYLLTDSADFGTEMNDAILGLKVLSVIGWVLAGGFLLSALGVLSLRPIGYRLQALWAILLCLTIVGLPYGVVVLVFLKRRATHARFFA